MQFSPECVPCLLNRVLYEVELVAPAKVEEAMSESLRIMSELYPRGMNSAELATRVHERAYSISGSADPYADLKHRSDEVAISLYPHANDLVRADSDPLAMAVRVAIAGNVLDFGIDVGLESPEELANRFNELVSEKLAIDDVAEAKKLMGKGSKVLYLLDNCGESVFDRLLVWEIRRIGAQTIGVVKGAPILTDVTMEDALRIHLDECFDEILSTDSFGVGLNPRKVGERLRNELEEADLIISKGMANLESLSDESYRPVLYLLRAKCEPVARLIGAKRNQNVAKLCR